MGKNFSICILGFRSLQPELAQANEINRDILRHNTLLEKGSLEKYGCRFKCNVTFHVSLSYLFHCKKWILITLFTDRAMRNNYSTGSTEKVGELYLIAQ